MLCYARQGSDEKRFWVPLKLAPLCHEARIGNDLATTFTPLGLLRVRTTPLVVDAVIEKIAVMNLYSLLARLFFFNCYFKSLSTRRVVSNVLGQRHEYG